MGIIAQIGGQRFGRLVVVSFVEIRQGNAYWLCHCDCGNEHIAAAHHLKKGGVTSCGCAKGTLITEKRTQHGDTIGRKQTSEWRSWWNMHDRCNNPENISYRNYGARGVSVEDPRWDDYATFLADMGRKPTPRHTLDRIDNNLGYFKENCRWATKNEQARNTRKTIPIGSRFGLFTVLSFSGVKQGNSQWLCQCDCGSERIVLGCNLKSGNSSSCGCTRRI
jgi:hypothetical protein